LRIAILTHSTNPRGGVVHALALGEALCGIGHEAVVHAPDPTGRGFFRDARCPVVSVAAKPVAEPTVALVRSRISDYLSHFSTPAACDFDVFHAHCGISGNALATLTRRRLIPGFVRTVHHIDALSDPQLSQWQERAILDAGRLLCLSQTWAAAIATEYGAQAEVVGNGVDGAVYTPETAPGDLTLRARLGLGAGPVFLSVGGFEARKNTLAIIGAPDRADGAERHACPLPNRRHAGLPVAERRLRPVRSGGDGLRHAGHRVGTTTLYRIPRPRRGAHG
jgi:hypothetical protein